MNFEFIVHSANSPIRSESLPYSGPKLAAASKYALKIKRANLPKKPYFQGIAAIRAVYSPP